MPPNTRDMPASSAAARNDSKCRTLWPIVRAVLSTNGIGFINAVSAAAPAADTVECPEKYSGKGGVGIAGSQARSIVRRMKVRGRTTFILNLYPHVEMNASAIETLTAVSAVTASFADRCC